MMIAILTKKSKALTSEYQHGNKDKIRSVKEGNAIIYVVVKSTAITKTIIRMGLKLSKERIIHL